MAYYLNCVRCVTMLFLMAMSACSGVEPLTMPDGGSASDAGAPEVCAPGFTDACTDLDASVYVVRCVNLDTDVTNCGACGNVCKPNNIGTRICTLGACEEPQCQPNYSCDAQVQRPDAGDSLVSVPGCGMILDGCGNAVQCGMCPEGQVCGSAARNICATRTCEHAGVTINQVDPTCCDGLIRDADYSNPNNIVIVCRCASGIPDDAGVCRGIWNGTP